MILEREREEEGGGGGKRGRRERERERECVCERERERERERGENIITHTHTNQNRSVYNAIINNSCTYAMLMKMLMNCERLHVLIKWTGLLRRSAMGLVTETRFQIDVKFNVCFQ